jgi:hypothetical protein
MRDRHVPRLCRSCRAPMARQEDACWCCGTNWATESAAVSTLRLVSGEALADAPSASHGPISTTPAGDRRAAVLALLDTDRWTGEGGTIGSEAALPSERLAARVAH